MGLAASIRHIRPPLELHFAFPHFVFRLVYKQGCVAKGFVPPVWRWVKVCVIEYCSGCADNEDAVLSLFFFSTFFSFFLSCDYSPDGTTCGLLGLASLFVQSADVIDSVFCFSLSTSLVLLL